MAEIAVPERGHKIVDDQGEASLIMFAWMQLISGLLQAGFTGTITTAALTGVGAQGSMTFENGILIDQTQAT